MQIGARVFLAAIAAAALLSACDATPPPKSPETAAKPLEGKAAAGPFASVEAWCKTLKATDCQARDDIVAHITLAPLTTRSGVKVEIVTAAWRDEATQRGVVLLKRGDELFALPPAIEYDPNDGKKHEATVASLQHFESEDASLVHVVTTATHPAKGAKRPDTTETREVHDLCTVEAGKPIRCARVVSGVVREWPDATQAEQSSASTVLLIEGLVMTIAIVVPRGPEGEALVPQVIQPGEYALQFP
jgi:hypothetical protein